MKKEHFSREEHLFFEDADSVLHDLTEWKNLEFFFKILFQAFSSENVLTEILFQKLFFHVWEQRKKTVKKSLKTFCLFSIFLGGFFPFSWLKPREKTFSGEILFFFLCETKWKKTFFSCVKPKERKKNGR